MQKGLVILYRTLTLSFGSARHTQPNLSKIYAYVDIIEGVLTAFLIMFKS